MVKRTSEGKRLNTKLFRVFTKNVDPKRIYQLRFNCWVTPEEKSSLILASNKDELNTTNFISDFIIRAALIRAKEIVEENPQLLELKTCLGFPKELRDDLKPIEFEIEIDWGAEETK